MNINETISRLNILLCDLTGTDNYEKSLEYIKAIKEHVKEQDAALKEKQATIDKLLQMWEDNETPTKAAIEKVEADK